MRQPMGPQAAGHDALGDLPNFNSAEAIPPQTVATDVASSSLCSSTAVPGDNDFDEGLKPSSASFLWFRLNYLLVCTVIFLSDGLQGTHLYVLYEGYGYSVASLYCLGFVAGAISAPVTGPLIDRFGRRRSALLYCALEVGINMLEQQPFLTGLIISRVVGGVTTNLLSSVFETWLDTEYRRRGFDTSEYETVMRDSVVVSNIAAIASGYIAHILAESFGPVGPFRGAVTCTSIAFVVILALWTENYGNSASKAMASQEENEGSKEPEQKSMREYLSGAIQSFRSDSRMLRVGIVQGLTTASVHIFIFLWSPTLAELAKQAYNGAVGLDRNGEPAYGLIFGAFMAAGVIGGLFSPVLRIAVAAIVSPNELSADGQPAIVRVPSEDMRDRPVAVEFLAACCYFGSALMLLVPFLIPATNLSAGSFSACIIAFLVYEVLIGVYLPCEGVIRSLYMPSEARASVMILPRIIVNVAVAIGVASTNVISMQTAFGVVSILMFVSCALQLSLVSEDEWECILGRVLSNDKVAKSPPKVKQQ